MARLPLGLFLAVFLFLPRLAAETERNVLWHVVQACVATHNLTGGSFPCLDVDTSKGAATGYAVLRAPFDKSHTIVSPTVQTIGIEAERLRGPSAPDYFQDAWAARHFATAGLARQPGRDDIALAVNSRAGRSQDQLHIHVDCIKAKVKLALARDASLIKPDSWTRLKILPGAPHFWASAVASDTLSGVNIFDLVADGLKIAPGDMDDATIVVVGADDVGGKPGFVILARQRIPNSRDEAHGEALMDHSCPAFR